MNNRELDDILKSAPVPERPQDYWDQFPGSVLAKLHWRTQSAAALREHGQPIPVSSGIRVLFAAGFALVCIVAAFALGFWKGHNSAAGDQTQLAEAQKCFREVEGLFPNQLESLVLDQSGAHLVLADAPNVPTSPPLYVKICGPAGCRRFVTFSGQQIRVNGDTFDVLVDRQGGVMLMGTQWVWSSSQPRQTAGGYRIAARLLPS